MSRSISESDLQYEIVPIITSNDISANDTCDNLNLDDRSSHSELLDPEINEFIFDSTSEDRHNEIPSQLLDPVINETVPDCQR